MFSIFGVGSDWLNNCQVYFEPATNFCNYINVLLKSSWMEMTFLKIQFPWRKGDEN